jgi:hypothetical protein
MPTPLILPSVTAGTSFRTYRRKLADELGSWQEMAVTAVGTNADAARVVLSDDLRDDEAGYEHIGGRWLYAASGLQADNQRRIISQPETGYQGAIGGVMLSRPFDAALQAGTLVEVTSPLPVKRHLGIKGHRDFINEGLGLIWVEARLSLTGNGTYAYDLSAYPWLTSYEQMRGIYDTAWQPTGAPSTLSPYGYRLVTNGATATLVTDRSYTTADTFEVAVLVRGDRLISDGLVWFYADEAAPGLQSDDQQAAAPARWVHAFAMVKALQYLTRLVVADRKMPADEKQAQLAEIMERRRTWARAAAEIKLKEFPTPLPERTVPLVGGTYGPVWS